MIDYITKNNPNAKIFGVTATPMRGNKNNIGVIFSNCSDQSSLIELISISYLVLSITDRVDTRETGKKLEVLNIRIW